MLLVLLALAPALVIGLYIYIRDKYEREPPSLLLLCLISGGIITPVAIITGRELQDLLSFSDFLGRLLYNAFVVAALNEELLKFIVFMSLIWHNRNFNEKFDGIVYAVFISLGFATVENLIYVLQNGYQTGIIRAITAVPGHALDGVIMGFFISKAKFDHKVKYRYLFAAFLAPWLLHGTWDMMVFFIRDGTPVGWSVGLVLWLFIAFFVLLYQLGMRQINKLVESSPFKKDKKDK